MKKNFLYLLGLMAFFFFPHSVYASNTVAKIGNQEYENLIDAFDNVQEEETITLFQDVNLVEMEEIYVVEFPAGVTLDLNGYDITIGWHTSYANGGGIGNLIFTGTNAIIKNGSFSGKPSYTLWIGDEVDTNNLVVENVTVNGGINVYNATEIILKNLVVNGHDYYAVWADNGAQITIQSGLYSTVGTHGLLGVTSNHPLENAMLIEGGKFITNNQKLYCDSTPLEALVIKAGMFNTDVKNIIGENLESKLLYDFYIVGEKDTNTELIADKIDLEQEAQKPVIGILDSSNVHKIILDAIYEKGELNLANKKTEIKLDITPIEGQEATQNEVRTVLKDKGEIIKIHQFFDIVINVIDIDSNQALGNVTQLKDKIKFAITLPKEMQKKNRSYYIVRKHNDSVEIVDTKVSEDGNTLTFETDCFSTYALAYIENIENPNTYDGIGFYIVGMIMSFAGLIYIFTYSLKHI